MDLLALISCLLASAHAASQPAPEQSNGYETAHEEYRATAEDFRVFERGLADAAKIAPKMFTRGVVGNDAVLYDTHDLYIYSRSKDYAFPKVRVNGGYQIYRVPVGRPVQEHEMAICNASAGPASVDVLRAVTERTLACAPWGSFRRIQTQRRSIYRFIEGYWASMIHEYGHEYDDLRTSDPSPEMSAIDALIAAAKLSPGTDRGRAADEGFASWCELEAARTLYPAHYRRLMGLARRVRKDDFYGHDAGLRAAAELIGSKTKN